MKINNEVAQALSEGKAVVVETNADGLSGREGCHILIGAVGAMQALAGEHLVVGYDLGGELKIQRSGGTPVANDRNIQDLVSTIAEAET